MLPDRHLQAWLEAFVREQGGVAGSVHTREGDLLLLRASVNLPPKVAEVTARIPRGKGMAGLAWERDECVATCNLKKDESGDVRPGAKAVDAAAAVAIPVRAADGELRAVVGVAYADDRVFAEDELARIESLAGAMP